MKKFILSLVLLYIFISYSIGQDTTSITLEIDFGNTQSTLPWNNVVNQTSGTLNHLISTLGATVPIAITVHDAFNGINNSGTNSPDPVINMPSSATGDSFFGNDVLFSEKIEPTGGVMITGLDPATKYDLSIFASRVANDNRETQYSVTGASNEVKTLSVSSNVDDLAIFSQLSPNAEGEIEIIASKGANNDNSSGFYYLGAIRIQYEGVVEIPDSELSLIYPNGGEFWQSNRSPEIRWKAVGIDSVNIEYSTDQGSSWSVVDKVSAFSNRYAWDIPELDSKNCSIRITADSFQVESLDQFEISSVDTTTCHIVVLGSSTAAGSGPTTRDSAWVWMYEDVLFQNDTRFNVTNLARGGYTTYNLLPDDATIPPEVSHMIDSSRNVSAAILLDPDALIINLPSNDASNGYVVETQLNNYRTMLALPENASIPYWICTTQPRNGLSQEKQEIQEVMRDSTFSVFGDFAIDFWGEIANDMGTVNPKYDSGDGVHLNNAGHKVLLERVLGTKIDSFLLNQKGVVSATQDFINYSALKVYPNPSSGPIYINQFTQPFRVSVYDADGNEVLKNKTVLNNSIDWSGKGMFYLFVEDGQKRYLSKVLRF